MENYSGTSEYSFTYRHRIHVTTINSPLALAEAGSVFFTHPHLPDYISNRGEKFMRSGDLFVVHRKGKLKVNNDKILPLIRITEAHQIMEAGLTQGRVLLKNS